jgi:radical SAM protein with 4Fe4S-binding SPASM domain
MQDRGGPADTTSIDDITAPRLVQWEVTSTCDLACRYCRLAAVRARHLDELSTEAGLRLIESLAATAQPRPRLLLMGGDPLKRADLYGLVARADELGMVVEIVLCATPRLTREAVAHLCARGVRTVRLRLDGSISTRHDGLRLVRGSFERTVAAARWVRELGSVLQIDTLVCEETVEDLSDIYQRVLDLDAGRWCVRFPIGGRAVRSGRGTVPAAPLRELDGYDCEAVLEWLCELAGESARPLIEVAEAPHVRRIALQRERLAAQQVSPVPGFHRWRPWRALAARWQHGQAAATPTVPNGRSGVVILAERDTMFISHTGEVYPSDTLPLSAGNVRDEDPLRLYCEAPLFRQFRDTAQLTGKCRACAFRTVCGGSRARAWATTGDPLADDPLCIYQPPGIVAATG